MNTWVPVFSKMVDSSIWDLPDEVCKIWVTMLAKKDADHVVRGTAYMIGHWSRHTEAEVMAALKILAAPDKKRLEPQPFEGRRIEKVADGWLVLNGQAYEDLMRSINRKAYKAAKQQEYREAAKNGKPAKHRSGVVTGGPLRERLFVEAEKAGQTPDQRLTEPATASPVDPSQDLPASG